MGHCGQVISATDNKVWKDQRNHLTEAFLPTSSLAKIFPVSVARAQACAEILKRLSQGGTQKVNMVSQCVLLRSATVVVSILSAVLAADNVRRLNVPRLLLFVVYLQTEFYLNETQQQLHLALFGQQEEDFDEDYNAMFRDSIGGPPGDDRYQLRHRQAQERAQEMAGKGRDGEHAFESLTRDGAGAQIASDKDAHTSQFLKDLNTFIKKNADSFAAPTDVAADPSKRISGPLSAVLAKQLDQVNSAQTMGDAYEALDDRLKAVLNGKAPHAMNMRLSMVFTARAFLTPVGRMLFGVNSQVTAT